MDSSDGEAGRTSSAKSSLTLSEPTKITREEALSLIGSMLNCYPNGGQQPREYVLSLAAVLSSFPLEIARAAANIRIGLVSECKFLPTAADLIEWCKARLDSRQARMRLSDVA